MCGLCLDAMNTFGNLEGSRPPVVRFWKLKATKKAADDRKSKSTDNPRSLKIARETVVRNMELAAKDLRTHK